MAILLADVMVSLVLFSVIKSECKSELDVEVSSLPDMVPTMNWDMTGCDLPDSFTDTSTGWHRVLHSCSSYSRTRHIEAITRQPLRMSHRACNCWFFVISNTFDGLIFNIYIYIQYQINCRLLINYSCICPN